MSYADFEYYTDTYKGSTILERDFPRLASRASSFLDYYTQGRSKLNPDLDALKMACCAIAEQMVLFDAPSSGSAGVKSESVGSYSVTYQTAEEKASGVSFANKIYASIARMYLSGTNLLYRGRC